MTGIDFRRSAERSEVYDGSVRIVPLNRAFRLSLRDYSRNVADHLPVVARFDITEDDD